MYLSVTQIDEHLYDTAKEFFITQGRSDLLYKKQDSLIGAYLITQYMLNNGKIGFSFQDGIYQYEDLYFSTSHSGDLIAIVIDDKKTAIDLELIKPRNDILLKDISILDEKLGPRENFYLQRCSKECLVKYLNLNIEKTNGCKINNIINRRTILENNQFEKTINLQYNHKTYKIYAKTIDNYVISILI